MRGDIIECGVHWGYGLLIHFHLIRALGEDRHIFGFDSFMGHSPATARDKTGGAFKDLSNLFAVSQDQVWRTLELGTGCSREELGATITLVPGWFDQTMPTFVEQQRVARAALIHLDADYYEPCSIALTTFWPLLAVGGVVIVGLLDNPELAGKTYAVREFLAGVPSDSYEVRQVPGSDVSYVLRKS